jgi:tetratricopeptide (TPR) repeat protein
MLTRFDEARAILSASRAELAGRGPGVLLANITAFESVWVELWAGKPADALRFALNGWELHLELGEHGFARGAAANVAQAYYVLDRLDEAEAWANRSSEASADEDLIYWKQVKAKVLARRGEHAEAERLARGAVRIVDAKDNVNGQGDAYADLAEVLAVAGRADEAAVAFETALERYARKENLAMVAQVRDRLGALRTPA